MAGYVLAVDALVLQSGKLGDNYGKKRIYLLGFAIFGIASALCGLSPSVYSLIAFRIIQGAGSGSLEHCPSPGQCSSRVRCFS